VRCSALTTAGGDAPTWMSELQGGPTAHSSVFGPPLSGAQQHAWIWTSTSAVMFRRSALEMTMTRRTRGIRISADFYLFQFCHLLGGTILIQGAHGAYRRHGTNNFARDVTLSHRTVTGSGRDHEAMWDLIRAEVVENRAALLDLLGRPRFVALIALLYPPTRLRAALRAQNSGGVTGSLLLVGHMLLRQLRILPRRLGRAFG